MAPNTKGGKKGGGGGQDTGNAKRGNDKVMNVMKTRAFDYLRKTGIYRNQTRIKVHVMNVNKG